MVDDVVDEQTLLAERSTAVIAGLDAIAPDHVLYLASSTLRFVLDHYLGGDAPAGTRTFAMPREEEGVGIATGLVLGGARPVLIMQDNGIGNLLTCLLTLPQAYHVPLFAVVARRGGLGEYNSVIHTFSERVPSVLDAAQVCWFALDSRTPLRCWPGAIVRGWQFAATTHRPVLMLVNLMGG